MLAGLGLCCFLVWLMVGFLLPTAPGGSSGTPAGASPRPAACVTAQLPHASSLGVFAWIDRGALFAFDLSTCGDRALVRSGSRPPMRFSPDGRWLAFGDGAVVPTAGGPVGRPFLHPITSWAWSPTREVLAAVTAGGGLALAAPRGMGTTLLPDGSGVGSLAFAPDGSRLAVARAGIGIELFSLGASGTTGALATLPTVTLPVVDRASLPQVAGWSPDGRWILYWRGPVRGEDDVLDAVPASGGDWANVWGHVAPLPGVVSSCRAEVMITAGAGTDLTAGKQILLSAPPAWGWRDLTDDPARSWFHPACSPDGRWVAVIDSLSQGGMPDQATTQALWLIASDGSSRRILVSGFAGLPEYPMWSSDGTVILLVDREGSQQSSAEHLLLVRVDPRTGTAAGKPAAVTNLGEGPASGQDWAAAADWHRGS